MTLSKSWSQKAGAFTILVGSFVLMGWAFNIPFLKNVLPDLAPMKVNTALAFLLTGVALWILTDKTADPRRQILAQICSAAVFLIGALTLTEYLFSWDLGIDQLLFREATASASTNFPVRMTQNTAFCFTVLGLSLWLLHRSERYVLSQILILSVLVLALLVLAGYLYGVDDLYRVVPFSSVAIHTALTFLVSSVGSLLARSDRGFMAVISKDSPGGVMARRLLPAVILVPLLIGWLRLKGEQLGFYGTEFGLALFALSNIFILTVLIWWNAHLLNGADNERKQAEEQTRKLNRLLAVLSDINQAIMRVRDDPALFASACQIAVEKGGFQMAWIGLLDAQTMRVNPVAHAGLIDGYLDKLDIVLTDEPRGQGPTASAIRAGEHDICNDIEHDPRMAPWWENMQRLGYRSSAAFPLKVSGEVRGALNLYAGELDFFNEEEIKLLDEMAMDISFAMEFAERDAQRQQAESALLENEKRYHHTLDNLLEGCQIIGFDWRYLYVNDSTARHGHQSKEDLLGHTMLERYPGIEETHMFAVLRRCMEERSVQSIENEFTYADGTKAWFELSIQPVPEGIFILSLDITKRKQAENTLLESEQQLRLFVEHAPAAIAMFDRNMNYLVASQRWITDYRLSDQHIIGRSHYEVFPEIPERWRDIHQRCLQGATETSEADPFLRADGALDWIHWEIHPWRKTDGEIGGIILFSEVITERKQAEEHIRKLNRTLAVLSDINQAIVRVRDRSVLFASACQIAVEKGGFRMAWIGLLDAQTMRVNPVAHAGLIDGYLDKLDIVLADEPRGQGPTASAIRAGEHDICNDIEHDPRMAPWWENMQRLGYRSSAAFPLKVSGEVRGALNLYAGEFDFFNEEEIKLLDEMAMDISFAMEFAERDAQRQQAEAELKRYAQRMEILHDIDTGIIEARSINDLIGAVFSRLRQIILCQHISVFLAEPSKNEGTVFAVDIDSPWASSAGAQVPLSPNWQEKFKADQTLVIDDLRLVVESNPAYKQVMQEGMLSALHTLLIAQGRAMGVLTLMASAPGHFTAERREIAIEVSAQLAIAIHQLHLSEELAHYTDELEQRVEERTAEVNHARERVEAILDNSLDGILLAYTDYRIRQTNPAFNKLFASRPDAYFNKSLLDLIHANDVNQVMAVTQTVIEEQIGRHVEIRCQRQDNTVFDAELSLGYINPTSDGQDGLVCTIRDITERRRIQNTLAEERNLLRTLIDTIPDYIFIKDTQHRTVLSNLARARSFGLNSPEDTIGKDDFDLVPAEMAAQFHADEDRLIQSGQPLIDREEQTVGLDGSVIWASTTKVPLRNLSGELIGLVGITRDITERKKQERQLRYHASLQENVSDAVITSDLDLHIQSWNHAAEMMYGWSAAEIIGKTLEEALQTQFPSEEERQNFRQAFFKQGLWSGEGVQRRKDGTELYFLGSITLLKDEQDIPYGIAAVIHDITESKRIAAELERQRTFLQRVIDVSPNMIFVKDYDGRFILVNPIVAQLYNTTPEALLGKTDADFNPQSKEVESFLEADRHVITSGTHLFVEEAVTDAQGKNHWFQTTKVPIISVDGKTNYVLGVSTDITERKKTEQALQAKLEEDQTFQRYLKALHEITIELAQIDQLDIFYKRVVELGLGRLGLERFALFLYNAEDGTAIGTHGTDINGMLTDERHLRFVPEPNGIMQRAFQRAERFYIDEAVPLYQDLQQIGVGWNASAALWDGTQIIGWLVADNWIHHKPASKPLLDIFPLYALTVGTLLKRKQIEAALRQSEASLQSVMNSTSVGIILVDRDGVIRLTNEPAHEYGNWLYGQRLEPGKTRVFDLDLTDRASIEQQFQKVFAGERMTYEFSKTAGSQLYFLDIRYDPVVTTDGEIIGAAVSFINITEHKRAEESLRQAFEKEKELGELKSRFVSMASHEFRTPLAAIMATAETLSAYRSRMTDHQIDQRLAKIREQVDQLKDIMEDVLQLAQMQARRVQFSPVILNLDSLCLGVIDEFQSQPNATHRLVYSCNDEQREVKLDKKLMRQIINNLVSNAIKYSPVGSTVTIELKYTDETIILRVQDEGIGIPAADLKHLFEAFHRASNVGTISGTGLGLTIAKESVDLHGGSIEVESQVDNGTTFTVTIPIVADDNMNHESFRGE